jgi:hypothetical protein
MTARRPEITRPFSAEYLAYSGRPVTRMMDGPYREYVDAAYVAWLEEELKKARAFVPHLEVK